MSIDLNDEILQDFLVEASEILELLSSQLIELEQSPQDNELLNSIFRGFHTVKGGAGFLNLTALVDVCHCSEDVFNVLRNGERKADANLMDVVLQSLDVVNDMFESVRAGVEPDPADPQLLEHLRTFATPEGEAPATDQSESASEQSVEAAPRTTETLSEPSDAIEAEFESMLQQAQLGDAEASSESVDTEASDEISEEEFEQLLDELHGSGKGPSVVADSSENKDAALASDEISEDEFESLLDELHGQGKGPTAVGESTVPPKAAPEPKSKAAEPTPEAKATPKPVTKEAVDAKPKAPAPAPAQAEVSVRVDTKRLDDIMNMVGELVLVRNRFSTLEATHEDEEMAKAIANLDLVTSDLQLAVMKTRMQPIKKVFGRFPRVVRDLARSLGKKINLEMQGEETDLDKNLVEALADPLVHLVRNAVDHGIELPEERTAAGKTEAGTVLLSASQEGDHILLSIEDDGKGMDADVLRASAVAKGMMDEDVAARLSDHDCYNLIFAPGFSTKTEISDVSGRGVGMDVVKTRIIQMNGTVEIDSELGRGSNIIIKVPLTLAIMPTLMVKLANQSFALPLASVVEILSLDLSKTNHVDGQLVVMVRGKALPLYNLGEWLIDTGRTTDVDENTEAIEHHVVVVSLGKQHIGFIVDNLVGQEEVVIKPLGALLTDVQGLSGATITGDGSIALILDIPSLMMRYSGRSSMMM